MTHRLGLSVHCRFHELGLRGSRIGEFRSFSRTLGDVTGLCVGNIESRGDVDRKLLTDSDYRV